MLSRSPSKEVRARVRVRVILGRRVLHGTKRAKACNEAAGRRRPAGTFQRRSSALHSSHTFLAAVLPETQSMYSKQHGAWKHGRCSLLLSFEMRRAIMIGACRAIKQRDKSHRNFWSNATFPKAHCCRFFKITSNNYLGRVFGDSRSKSGGKKSATTP